MKLHDSKLPQHGTTIFTVMSQLANAHGAINLSQGFPDFDAPAGLLERVEHHLRAGRNQYAPMTGVPELREQIALKTAQLYGRTRPAGSARFSCGLGSRRGCEQPQHTHDRAEHPAQSDWRRAG